MIYRAAACGVLFAVASCAGAESFPAASGLGEAQFATITEGVGGKAFFRSGNCSLGFQPGASCAVNVIAGSVVAIETAVDLSAAPKCSFRPSAQFSPLSGDAVDIVVGQVSATTSIAADGIYALGLRAGEYRLYVVDSAGCGRDARYSKAVAPDPLRLASGERIAFDFFIDYGAR